jgi:hypothetical protein
VPSLIYQLAHASNQKSVDFNSIVSSASSTPSTSTPAIPGAAAASFSQLPFTFVFEGSFFDLEHLFRQLADFTTLTSSGGIQVSGRLLTIQSVKLAPATSTSTKSAGTSKLTGTITASAYVLPASQATANATSTSPTGAATAASSTAAASSPTAPAIVKVNP